MSLWSVEDSKINSCRQLLTAATETNFIENETISVSKRSPAKDMGAMRGERMSGTQSPPKVALALSLTGTIFKLCGSPRHSGGGGRGRKARGAWPPARFTLPSILPPLAKKLGLRPPSLEGQAPSLPGVLRLSPMVIERLSSG